YREVAATDVPATRQKFLAGQSATLPQALLGVQYLLRAAQAQLGRSKKLSASQACRSWRSWACQAPELPTGREVVCGAGASGASMGCMGGAPWFRLPISSPTSAMPVKWVAPPPPAICCASTMVMDVVATAMT